MLIKSALHSLRIKYTNPAYTPMYKLKEIIKLGNKHHLGLKV